METARRHGPVFLERDTYRARRWIDVARILPVVGACLWSVPLLWQQAAVNTSVAGLFIFGIWCLLVVVSYTLSNRLRRNSVMTEPADPGRVETSR
ncbi:MAG: hypothetical protein CSA70_10830 [Rhodobacterales bacterium]|nr:MAG: hypothetical protein CSA70_10830 [Rhodobacterales bacterium]